MASFLMTCPKCRAMIAKDIACPDCRWSEAAESAAPADPRLFHEFARREGNHKRNYALFMALMLTTGFVSLVTAIMWVRFIFLGSVIAFFWIILLTVFSAGLGVVLRCAKTWLPVELHCPSCSVRIDQLGLTGDQCPACNTRLK